VGPVHVLWSRSSKHGALKPLYTPLQMGARPILPVCFLCLVAGSLWLIYYVLVVPYILSLTFLFLREGSFVGDSDRVHRHLNIILGSSPLNCFSSVYCVLVQTNWMSLLLFRDCRAECNVYTMGFRLLIVALLVIEQLRLSLYLGIFQAVFGDSPSGFCSLVYVLSIHVHVFSLSSTRGVGCDHKLSDVLEVLVISSSHTHLIITKGCLCGKVVVPASRLCMDFGCDHEFSLHGRLFSVERRSMCSSFFHFLVYACITHIAGVFFLICCLPIQTR
jgi:hypothetical protein